MRLILTAVLGTFLLSGCTAEWKGSNKAPQRTALEGFPGVTCEEGERLQPGTHLPNKPLCLNQRQWAARDNPRRAAGLYHPAPLYPNFADAQVAPNGNPPPGPAWNPNP